MQSVVLFLCLYSIPGSVVNNLDMSQNGLHFECQSVENCMDVRVPFYNTLVDPDWAEAFLLRISVL